MVNESNGGAWVYILRCADGSYYKTSDKAGGARRLVNGEHNEGIYEDSYTSTRRPVKLVYAEDFELVVDAIAAERRIKGWSRRKKEALMAGDWQRLVELSKRRGKS
jgi:putative endonuclease